MDKQKWGVIIATWIILIQYSAISKQQTKYWRKMNYLFISEVHIYDIYDRHKWGRKVVKVDNDSHIGVAMRLFSAKDVSISSLLIQQC